jgi:hypothetical protein
MTFADSDIFNIIAIAMLLGFLTARIASRKGGGFFKWFLAGALFAVVALPVAVLKGRRVSMPEVFKKCPQCSHELTASTLLCEHCDYNFLSMTTKHPRLMPPSEKLERASGDLKQSHYAGVRLAIN